MQSPPNPKRNASKYIFLLIITQAFVISKKPQKRLLMFFSIGRAEIIPINVENSTTNEQTDRIDLEACAVDSTKVSVITIFLFSLVVISS